jgi:hypothetical protein
MPKTTLRANARTMPKTEPHRDAEIFDLVTKAFEAEKVHTVTQERLASIEERKREHKWPDALRRTERDRELGFFVGNDIGGRYERDEIDLIRSLHRRTGRLPVEEGGEAHVRASEILSIWNAWRSSVKIENERLDWAAAEAAYCDALERHDHILKVVALTPAATVDGLFAKARAFEFYLMPDDVSIGKALRALIEQSGVDDETVSVALTRDIAALARKAEAAQ